MEKKNAIAAAYESGNAAAIQAALLEKQKENEIRGFSWESPYLNISNCYIAYENKKAAQRLLDDGYTLVKGVHENMIVPDTYCDGTGTVCLCEVYFVFGFKSGKEFSRYMRENSLLYKGEIEPLACTYSCRWY